MSIVSLLANIVLFRDGDLPSRTVNGDAAAFDRELVRAEHQDLGMNGRLLARALFQINERFGIPSQADLTAFLADIGADPSLANALATALQLYWIGEYDASYHLVVPKVEAAARALLLELNEPVYRTAIGDASGHFPGLGTLLPYLLANDFDPDWERFLRTFLLNDGVNIRNLIAQPDLPAAELLPFTGRLAARKRTPSSSAANGSTRPSAVTRSGSPGFVACRTDTTPSVGSCELGDNRRPSSELTNVDLPDDT
ncbi:hypothetical protein GCM10027610_070970 [Dactylosporangium cerinum]